MIESLKAEIEHKLGAKLSGLKLEEVAVLALPQQRLGREQPEHASEAAQPDPARPVPWPTPDQGADHGQPGNHAAPVAGASTR